jgi:hypothetical protein
MVRDEPADQFDQSIAQLSGRPSTRNPAIFWLGAALPVSLYRRFILLWFEGGSTGI